MNEQITIFIPTYKRPHFLKKAIESALNQTWKDLQVIVCDNASCDETPDVVSKLMREDARLKYVCHAENLGMLGNYHYCLSTVETEFFSFLSDDDLLLPHFCKTVLEGFSRFPEIAFFAASTIIFEKEKGVLDIPFNRWPREGLFQPKEGLLEMMGKCPIPTTVAFRRWVGSYASIDFSNQAIWDRDFLIQLASQFPFAISKEKCGLFRVHEGAFSTNVDYKNALKANSHLIVRIDLFPAIDPSIRSKIKQALHRDLFQTAHAFFRGALLQKKPQEAKKIAQELIKEYSQHPLTIALLLISSICCLFPFLCQLPILAKHLRDVYRK